MPPPPSTLFPYTTLFRSASGDPAVERPLSALADGNLYIRKADSQVFVGKDAGDGIELLDPLSGEKAADAAKADLTKIDRKSTRLNSSHRCISYAVFCLKK